MHRIQTCLMAALVVMLSLTGVAWAADAPADLPEPQAPVKMKLEDGRVNVYVGTPRVSSYQIGDSIPVRIVFELMPDTVYKALHPVKPPVTVLPQVAHPAPAKEGDVAKPQPPVMLELPMIDVENLKMGVLTGQPSDVEMLRNATVTRYQKNDGTVMVVVDFSVAAYVTTQKTQVGVSADFMYAVSKLPDGQPAYQSMTTTEMVVGLTKAATDNQTLLIEGDLSPKTSPRVPAAFWFLAVSPLFALPMVVSFAFIGYNMVTRKRAMTKNEKTWVTFDQVSHDAAGAFSLEHYRKIFHALRAHFDVLGLDTTQTLSVLQARTDLNREAVDYVFNRETVFFDPNATISTEQHEKLIASLAILIPRH